MWSKYQLDVFNSGIDHDFDKPWYNLCVNAVAGSGKSTTAVELMIRYIAKYPDRKVLFLAFNKHIVEELKAKVHKKIGDNRNIKVQTCHAYGVATLNGNKGRKTPKGVVIKRNLAIDKNKYYHIANMLGKTWKMTEEEFSRNVVKIVNLADFGRLYLASSKEDLLDIATHHNIDIVSNEDEYAWQLIKYGAKYTDKCDFTDMLYLPIVHNLYSFTYDLVIIDEAQDLSDAQRYLMLKALKPNGKFVALGDVKQAINGFAGSNNDSFDRLLEIPNTKLLPLSICYRCDKVIIETAKEWVPEIEWFDGNEYGVKVVADSWKNIRSGDMVLCRNTYPLIFMCLKYWAEGKKAYVKGKDIGAGLVNLIKQNIPASGGGRVPYKQKGPMKINPVMASRIDLLVKNMYDDLSSHATRIAAKHEISVDQAKKTNSYALMEEKISAIKIISQDCSTIKDIIVKCEAIFSDQESEGICLSTIHKSKGLENDRVFIIHWDLIPSKFARKSWELQQEENLKYVAVTRAKHYLGFVADFTAYDSVGKKVEHS